MDKIEKIGNDIIFFSQTYSLLASRIKDLGDNLKHRSYNTLEHRMELFHNECVEINELLDKVHKMAKEELERHYMGVYDECQK